MLANPIFIIISLNQWSKILTRAFNLNVIHGQYLTAKVLGTNQMKRSRMSEDSTTSNIEIPSTSGCSPSKCDNIKKTCKQQSFENKECEKDDNVIIINPIMVMQSVTSAIAKVGYCQSGTNTLNEFSVSGSISKRYCHRYQIDECGSTGNSKMERNKDQEFLALRTWDSVTKEKHSTKPGFIFSLMCYNVLAQDLVRQHPHLYYDHDEASLPWKTRWKNLFKEINKLNPDILCLQEVQESHLKDYFSMFEALGYRSLYKKRTGGRTDGCAIYYKSEIMNLVEYTTVEYYQPYVTLLNRDNVGIVAKFVPKLHPTREFVVATTHLLYNRNRQDIRLAQMQVLLTEVERISYKSSSEGDYLPVILTGDLNSSPDSAIYDFITKGVLYYECLSPKLLLRDTDRFTGKVLVPPSLRITDNCQHADLLEKRKGKEKITRSEEMALIELFNSGMPMQKQYKRKYINTNLFCTGTLSHNFAFKSAYDHGKWQNLEGTTFQEDWLTVDYIFYSVKKDDNFAEDKLKLLSRYRLPTKHQLDDVKIPNSVLGSDHLSLMTKFKLEY